MPVGQAAGLRNQPMTLQQGTAASTTEGDAYLEWATINYLWASITPMTTQELLLAAQRGEEVTHNITIAWRPGFPVVQDLRILMGNRQFFVVGATDVDEQHRSIVMRCREVVTSQAGTG